MTLSAHDVFVASTALVESLTAKIDTNSGMLDVEDLRNLRDVIAWIGRDAEASDALDLPADKARTTEISDLFR